jgi:hypothetical protein
MSPATLALGFVPVVLYSVVVHGAGQDRVPAAALVSFAVAAILIARSRLRGESPKMLVVTSAVTFAAYAVVSLVDRSTEHFLAGYGRALAALVLAVVVFATLPVLPFTEQFAREMVPDQVAARPRFHALNRRLSAVWGGVILGLAVGHGLATALADQLGRAGEVVLARGIPAVLLVAAVRYTGRLTAGTQPQAHSPA